MSKKIAQSEVVVTEADANVTDVTAIIEADANVADAEASNEDASTSDADAAYVANKYVAAMQTRRIYEASQERTACAATFKKVDKITLRFSFSDVAALLDASKFDAATCNKQITSKLRYAIYNLERVALIADEASRQTILSNVCDYHIFKTARLHHEADKLMLASTAIDVLSNKRKFDAETSAIVSQRNEAYDTEKRQSDITLSALCELNVLRKTFNEARQVCYAVNEGNAIYQALCEAN